MEQIQPMIAVGTLDGQGVDRFRAGEFTLSLFSSQVQAAALDRRKRPVSMSLQPFIEFINGSLTLSL